MPTMLANAPSSETPFHLEIKPQYARLSSVGLISGKRVEATLLQGKAGSGSCFVFSGGERLPINATYVANSARGITLVSPTGQPLSIVEHYLAALSLSGLEDIECHLSEGATEVPLLDGSSLPWFNALSEAFRYNPTPYTHRITAPYFFSMPKSNAIIYALPSSTLQLSYTLKYTHVSLNHTWATWALPAQHIEKVRSIQHLLQCRTFGEVSELPALHASGLAKGVSLENTLGLLEDNLGFTSPLRCDAEPHHHKMLDFMGDAYLSGLRLSQIQGKFCLLYAGHSSHLAFCQALIQQPDILMPI
jgi:UDP-3-O-[3-hydroxymyristoyl] N-acetylglucosamine deacetylase